MIGKTLGHYRIMDALGKGGMGQVWVADDMRLNRKVALKTLPPEMAADPDRRARFEREAHAIAAINHPNIVTIYSVEESGSVSFITMELVDGRTLTKLIPRDGLPPERFFDIAIPLADALAAAHENSVTHRDLKPENVMVTAEGRLKVLDFGLAKLGESNPVMPDDDTRTRAPVTREGVVMGTVPYMSPEQAEGKAVDHRTDIFSLGTLLYEMATGSRPFHGETSLALMASILKDTPVMDRIRGDLPLQLGRLIGRCLEKATGDRYQTAGDIVSELRGLHREWDSGSTAPMAPANNLARSLAVLPFANMSGNPEDEYFSDGITDEIIHTLSRLPGWRVAARTSAFSFKGRAVDIGEVGAKLGVGKVLEGSVRRGGDRVRITVQLVDVAGGHQLWSERFDRELGDIFDLQDEVAGAIAAALSVELGGEAAPRVARRTADPEAYDRLLRGRFHLEQRGTGLLRALEAFESAVALDPRLAEAHAGLAEAYGLLGFYGSRPGQDVMPRAREAAERALELDPDLAEAHTALGWVHFTYDWDNEGTAREFRRALELEPHNQLARQWYACYVLITLENRVEEALALCRESVELDPFSLAVHGAYATALISCQRFEQTIELVDRVIDLHTGAYLLWNHRSMSHLCLGHLEQAREGYEHAISLSTINSWSRAGLGVTLARLGDTAGAERIQAELLRERDSGYVSPLVLALTPSNLGRVDEAFAHIEHGLDARDGLVRSLPAWEPLLRQGDDPRYAKLLERLRLPVR